MPVYAPVILTSLKAIAKAFGVPEPVVKQWEQEDAPIVKEGTGTRARYRAEQAALWEWFMEAKKQPKA